MSVVWSSLIIILLLLLPLRLTVASYPTFICPHSVFIASCRRAGLVPIVDGSRAIDDRDMFGLEPGLCSYSEGVSPHNFFLSHNRLPAAAMLALPVVSPLLVKDPFVPLSTFYARLDEAVSTPSLPTNYISRSLDLVKLKADMVSLPSASALNRVPLLSLLPVHIAAIYASSESLLTSPSMIAQRIADANLCEPSVWADEGEYVKLVKRMLQLSMLRFTDRPICVNGIFGVTKPDGQTRLILDARPANCWFVDPPHVSLPSPSHLSRLVVPAGQPIWVAKSDLIQLLPSADIT